MVDLVHAGNALELIRVCISANPNGKHGDTIALLGVGRRLGSPLGIGQPIRDHFNESLALREGVSIEEIPGHVNGIGSVCESTSIADTVDAILQRQRVCKQWTLHLTVCREGDNANAIAQCPSELSAIHPVMQIPHHQRPVVSDGP